MKQKQDLIQQFTEQLPAPCSFIGIGAVERSLAHLDVPVTELMPDKLVKHISEIVKAVGIYGIACFANRRRQARANPAIGEARLIPD